jgi:ABC-type nitrate/sulfonate/bicarbonate transport system substrate-binding protein
MAEQSDGMSRLSLGRRTFLRSGIAAPALAPGLGRAQSIENVDLLLDWKAAPTYAGFYLAREIGAFRKRGVDVRLVEGHGATAAAQLVGQGNNYWIGSSSGAATAIGRTKGQAVRSLAVYYRRTPTVVYARAEDHIDAPRDLYGKKIGLVPGSVTIDEYRALLVANRLDRARITEVEVDWSAKTLLDHTVDALIDYEEIAPAELIAKGQKISIMRLADFGVRLYSLNLVVNDDAWAAPGRKAVARKIAEALQEGFGMVRDRPREAATIFKRLFPDVEPRYVDQSMITVGRQLGTLQIGLQTRVGWEDTLKILTTLGLLSRPVGPEEVAILD